MFCSKLVSQPYEAKCWGEMRLVDYESGEDMKCKGIKEKNVPKLFYLSVFFPVIFAIILPLKIHVTSFSIFIQSKFDDENLKYSYELILKKECFIFPAI